MHPTKMNALILPRMSAGWRGLLGGIQLLMIASLLSASARTLYVSQTGNDTTGDGSTQRPYRTAAKAHTIAVAGDVLAISDGHFQESIRFDKRVELQGWGSARPLLGARPVEPVVNQPPRAVAGAEPYIVRICPGTPIDTNLPPGGLPLLPGVTEAMLIGNYVDDGLPNPPGVVTGNWHQVSGPAPAWLSSRSSMRALARFDTLGTYVFRLTVGDGALTGAADATVVVQSLVGCPGTPCFGHSLVTSPSQCIQVPGAASLPVSTTVSAQLMRNGYPVPPGEVLYEWLPFSGPARPVILSPLSGTTIVVLPAAGAYKFRVYARSGDCRMVGHTSVRVTTESCGAGGSPIAAFAEMMPASSGPDERPPARLRLRYLSEPGLPAGTAELQILGPRESLYQVEASPDLLHWTPLGLVYSEEESQLYWDTAAGEQPKRFYRVVR